MRIPFSRIHRAFPELDRYREVLALQPDSRDGDYVIRESAALDPKD